MLMTKLCFLAGVIIYFNCESGVGDCSVSPTPSLTEYSKESSNPAGHQLPCAVIHIRVYTV